MASIVKATITNAHALLSHSLRRKKKLNGEKKRSENVGAARNGNHGRLIGNSWTPINNSEMEMLLCGGIGNCDTKTSAGPCHIATLPHCHMLYTILVYVWHVCVLCTAPVVSRAHDFVNWCSVPQQTIKHEQAKRLCGTLFIHHWHVASAAAGKKTTFKTACNVLLCMHLYTHIIVYYGLSSTSRHGIYFTKNLAIDICRTYRAWCIHCMEQRMRMLCENTSPTHAHESLIIKRFQAHYLLLCVLQKNGVFYALVWFYSNRAAISC